MTLDPCAPLRQVNERIARACRRVGRDPEDVRLVAVSKTFAPERVQEILACGQHLFGENKVQEALDKIPAVGEGATWHMIGHLQRNKARHVVGLFELIHGVDSIKLAQELDRRAESAGLRQPILIQVNLSREATKSGITDEELAGALDAISNLSHVELRGLMTIPPPVERAEDARKWFVGLREIRAAAARHLQVELPELSMGMSDDFEVAVEEGATLVRVGRAIFGER